VIATVQEVHRFPVDDAIALFGEIQNKSVKPITFDPSAITIGIGDRQYPSVFVDCAARVEAEAAIRFAVVGQGDVDEPTNRLPGVRASQVPSRSFGARCLLPPRRGSEFESRRVQIKYQSGSASDKHHQRWDKNSA
jgi:hypothetical protein